MVGAFVKAGWSGVSGAMPSIIGSIRAMPGSAWSATKGASGSAWSAARGAPGKGKQAFRNSHLGGVAEDLRRLDDLTPDNFSPQKISDWFNTRIFGSKRSPTYTRTELPTADNSAFGGWEANAGMGHNLREFAGKHWVKGAVGAAGVYGINRLDEGIGSLYGGPGYGGYLGYGEGAHSERNALQGAVTNMNYQGQMMGLQALSSNQVAPQYSLTIAPMRQRRASAALRDSTQGLALGLHKGRHGGY